MSLPFPALQSLSISIDDDTEHLLLPFLARLGVPALDELTIRYDIRLSVTVDRRLPATQIHDVLLNVSRSTRMRSFTLQGFELAAPPEDEHVLDLSILAPLLSLHDLETLEMRGVPVLLSSDDAATVARSWPKLRYLRICDKVRFEEPLRRRLLQADDLLPFARHCPKLETLGLPLEIVATSVPAGAPDLPPPSRIHKLCVAGVAERVSRDMLELFTRVFPWADVRAPSHSAGEAIWNLSVRGDLTDEDEDHEGEEEVEHERDEDESAEES
ncbi:hypothetical protein PsYK624_118350 [Phanerochaete sordida]|uniref:Uncharacterized protein n=1 Tax=Phanerochaete sordida TaxID=48140 RepID=A0A9P3LIG7_9APHY|nr:hypothetical protein PsYK624_118350 [Phanerochaete sordida]